MANRNSKGRGGEDDAPITIKKYANRRLYNTATSSYVTLDHLCQMVKDGSDFAVYDAKTGEDITRSVLTQIIVEEESKGQNLLPIGFLRQLIGLYGDQMQWMVPKYLESAMQAFAHNQDQLRQYVQGTMGGMFPFSGALEEMGKQNVAMMEQAMKMFSPFPQGQEGQGDQSPAAALTPEQQLAEMQRRLDELQKQMSQLTPRSEGSESGGGDDGKSAGGKTGGGSTA
ncbi:MAG: polyhydroxyalkanoate synthesis repressor PhaR [Azospirillaceae bacterium]